MATPFRDHELNLIRNLIPAHFYFQVVQLNALPAEVERLNKRIQELENPVDFRFREHRGSLDDSMSTEKVLTSNSMDALVSYVKDILKTYPLDVDRSKVLVESYSKDERNKGWSNTYIVSVKYYGVVGFTNYMPV